MRLPTLLILCLCWFGPVAATGANTTAPAQGIGPGDMAPDIGGVALSGEPARLSELRGKVVIVDFWASFCGPCIIAMPELNQLRKEIHAMGMGDRFEILGVGMDHDLDHAKAFLERYPVDYPVISDMLGIASKMYGVWRLPATYILNPQGRTMMVYHGYGEAFGPDMRQKTLELLQNPENATPSWLQAPDPKP